MLKGDYFARQVALLNVASNGAIGRAQSLTGVITFDGSGNYKFSGQMADTQVGQAQSYSASGTYSVASNGMLRMQNPMNPSDTDIGGVGAVGPSAIVASATEGSYHDTLIAIPAGTGVSNGNLQGAYNGVFLDFSGGSSNKVRDGYISFSSDGQGNLGTLTINGSAADQGSLPTTQTASNVTYSFTANGSGTINIGASPSLFNGTKSFYISQDGNLVLGGSPAGFDILIGAKAVIPASNGIYLGTYHLAGMEDDASQLSQGQSYIDSFYGSAN
ncbi:MAG TPA: hypothetical protein VH157_16445, partial [Bryobacteraceae bacterium]|nr:hypothetical protein [Bryobacteraceae bacterium]